MTLAVPVFRVQGRFIWGGWVPFSMAGRGVLLAALAMIVLASSSGARSIVSSAASSNDGPMRCSGTAPQEPGCVIQGETGPNWQVTFYLAQDYTGLFSIDVASENGNHVTTVCVRDSTVFEVLRCQPEAFGEVPSGPTRFSFYAGIDRLDDVVPGAPGTPQEPLAKGSWSAAVNLDSPS
jgi:hypothetical protein